MRTLKNFEKKQRGTPSFPCAVYRVTKNTPDYCMPFHWHAEYEIVFMRKGKMELSVNDVTYHLAEGDVLFIADGCLHGGAPVGDSCVYDCVVFGGEVLSKATSVTEIKSILCHGRAVRTYMSASEFPKISAAAKRLSDLLLMTDGSARELICLGALLEFFGNIVQYECCTDGFSETNRHIQKLKNVLSYMEEHYADKITLGELAMCAGLTPKYLCRAFFSLTGKTPMSYLNEYRIDCACEMLRGTDKTMLDIAVSCGFSDQSYFVKWFKRLKGATPREYRGGVEK